MKDTGPGLGSPSLAAKESASVVTIRQKPYSIHVAPPVMLFEAQRLRPIAATRSPQDLKCPYSLQRTVGLMSS